MNWISLSSESPGVVRDENGIYTNFPSSVYAGREVESAMIHEIWHLKSRNLFGDGVPEDKKTPGMRRRFELLKTVFDKAMEEKDRFSRHAVRMNLSFSAK